MILAKTVGGPKEVLLNPSVYKDGVILSSLCASFAFLFQGSYKSYNLLLQHSLCFGLKIYKGDPRNNKN